MGCGGSKEEAQAGTPKAKQPEIGVPPMPQQQSEDIVHTKDIVHTPRSPQFCTSFAEGRHESGAVPVKPTQPIWEKTPLAQMRELPQRDAKSCSYEFALRAIVPELSAAQNGALATSSKAALEKATMMQQANQLKRGAHLQPNAEIAYDEACALILYTALCNDDDSLSYYKRVNTLLRERSPKIAPYIPMLRLLTLALKKLVPAGNQTTFRGIRGDMQDDYEMGSVFTWHAFTSTTTSLNVIEGFMGKEGDRTIFVIGSSGGYDIKRFSLEATQDEILLTCVVRLGLSLACQRTSLRGCSVAVSVLACSSHPHGTHHAMARDRTAAGRAPLSESPVCFTPVAGSPSSTCRRWRPRQMG